MNTAQTIILLVSLAPIAAALLVGLICVLYAVGVIREPATRKAVHMTPEQIERTLMLAEYRRDVA